MEVSLNSDTAEKHLPFDVSLLGPCEDLSELEVPDELDGEVESAILRAVVSLELGSGEVEVHDATNFVIVLTLLVVKVFAGQDEAPLSKLFGVLASLSVRSDTDHFFLKDAWIVFALP